jgi:hypothetical protein
MNRTSTLTAFAALAIASTTVLAQYPTITPEVKAAKEEKDRLLNQHSDEAWQKALPAIEEWAKKGKPYIPWASKPTDLPQASVPAFPGAEGGGAWSFGGRGGKVYVVTSLEDRGPGTFREACEAGGPRIVVFNVAGIINLKEKIRVRAPYITIAGNTAPGDGVCIAGDTVELEGHDIVVRHMRFRRGNLWVGDRNDSIGGNPVGNVMIDHVSASWGSDENMSMYRHMYQPPGGGRELKLPTVNISIQNSIFSECLNTYHHAFGSTIGGYNSTFHHNLWANNAGRNPSVGMNGDFGFVNNVIYNWRHRSVDGGDDVSYFNVINNYFKPGPATPTDRAIGHRILKPESSRDKNKRDQFGKAYVNGNVVEGNAKVTNDNWAGGVQLADQGDPGFTTGGDRRLEKIRVNEPLPMAHVTIMPAKDAYEFVLANAGATLPKRDPVDERITNAVRTGKPTAKVPDREKLMAELKVSGFTAERINEIAELIPTGIITNPDQVGGYPEYMGTPYKDSDSDGMPDEWESKYGLNPNDASDSANDLNGDGYTNIEKFIYGLDPAKKIDWSDPKNNVDPLMAR